MKNGERTRQIRFLNSSRDPGSLKASPEAGSGQFSILNFILIAFLALCFVYNVTLPVFEAPDEASHFIYTDYLAREQRLPDLNGALPSHESAQPPLYYILAALVAYPFDRSNLPQLIQLNPDWFDKSLNADFVSVRNQHVHTDAENFPYQGAVWAVRAGRLFSSLLGAATIVLVYLIARGVFRTPHSPLSTLAAALVAFNPKFIHVSSVVSNDIAIVLASTLSCWWMVRLAAPPPTPKGRGQEGVGFLVLGALIGAAVLCKLQGLGLFLPAMAAVFLIEPRRFIVKRLLSLFIGFALVAGWWLVLNAMQYGDPLALNTVARANAPMLREPPLDLAQIVATIPTWFTTYWGGVGVELRYPGWLDAIFFIALALAVIGCVVAFAKGLPLIANHLGLWLLLLTEAALVAMYVLWLRIYVGTENSRLVMAGLAPIAILVVMGWFTLVPERGWPALATGASTALLALSLATPFITIQPAFAMPGMMTEEQIITAYKLPNGGVATFDGTVKLLHAELGERRVKPGEHVLVTLYWGAIQPINQSYRVVLEALDGNNEVIGRKQFIPFNGRFATQRWQPGQFFRDDYMLPIDGDAQRGAARIQLSVFAQYPRPGLVPIDGANADTFLVGRVKVDAPSATPPALTESSPATFGQMIRLDEMNVHPSEIAFTWTALKQPDKDYTLFVHVLDAEGNMIAQSDAQPFDGQYPTGLWDANERVRDARKITLPDGAVRLRIGWYDAPTGQRLPAHKADGAPWPDDTVLLDIP